MEIEYETGETAPGNVVTVEETAPHAYKGAFVTDLAVGSAARAALLCGWGRRRWNIENGFHALKGRDGFGLEHCFCNDERAGENLHTLMTIARTLWQLLHTGYLKRLERKHRHCTQICWAELLWEALRCESLNAEALEARVGARRMRFAKECRSGRDGPGPRMPTSEALARRVGERGRLAPRSGFPGLPARKTSPTIPNRAVVVPATARFGISAG